MYDSKIYPSDNNKYGRHDDNMLAKERVYGDDDIDGYGTDSRRHSTLTVWKRSSMSFQGTDGFTVFDEHGRLVFRVDNYSRSNRCVASAGLVLMDGAGNALLSLKPQTLSMQYQWNAYREEEDDDGCGKSPRRCKVFSLRGSSVFFHSSKEKAEVFMGGAEARKQADAVPDFTIEGSFRRRSCKIRNGNGQLVAKIARKRVNSNNSTIMLSDDVFSLVVQPGYSTEIIMAFVVILDRIFIKPYTPVLCS